MTRNRILVVDDEPSIRMAIRRFLTGAGFEVSDADNRASALSQARKERPDAIILDYQLRDCTALDLLPQFKMIDASVAVIVLTAHGSVELAVSAIKEGAEQFLTKPVELPTLLVILNRTLDTQRSRQADQADRKKESRDVLDPFIGTSARIKQLESDVQKVVSTDRPILIQGETGTGKGILGNWLHRNGRRHQEPFVDLNCAGLSKDFLESELFGHERGAFTGAVQAKQGLLDLAHRGTLFLDEIGDVDPQVQPKLLKVLEEKRFRRLGDVKDRTADVRLVAATHHDMNLLVRSHRFREDLYFRISTIVLHLPALRERVEDIEVLAADILARVAHELGRPGASLAESGVRALQEYSWPGNIRELKNVLERSLLLSDRNEIRRGDLRFGQGSSDTATDDSRLTLTDVEARHITRALKEEDGNVERAAKRLGVTRNTLYYKMRKHRIALPKDSKTVFENSKSAQVP
ncbi:MAG: sigma-54-dependent Fis family transcriptional regulator [Acidobacteria bacterium]|nr:sigma-54-dependent Fis family transcriptional regulator [Acidobacteriota bacterium]